MKHTALYYDFHEGVKCVQDLIETNNMSWNQGNMLKAVVRMGAKGGASDKKYDLEKNIYFATRELQLMQGNPRTDAYATEKLDKEWAKDMGMSPMPGEKE